MNITTPSITASEVPDEISLVISVYGCPFKCDGCHSPYLQGEGGFKLTIEYIQKQISKYDGMISCICFMGGDQYKTELVDFLSWIKTNTNLKTCLYTGSEKVSRKIKNNLDYLKTGRYENELGGLQNKATNQRMVNVITNEDITYRFWND